MTNNIDLGLTIVFWKNWNAFNAINPDGSRKYKYIINKGSSRSSKTYSLIDLIDIYARQNHNKRVTIWRETKEICKKTVLNDMLKHHKTTNRYKNDYSFNKTESIFYYNHNNNESTTTKVEIQGTDDEELVHGFTQDIAWINEPYKLSKATFDQIDMRSDVIFIDYNPKKDSFIDDLMKQDNAIVINSTFRDNPYCPEESRIKILSYQPLDYSYLILSGLESRDNIINFQHIEDLRSYLELKDYSKKYTNELLRCFKNEKVQHSASEFDWQVYGLGEKAENKNKIYHGWIPITDDEYNDYKKHHSPIIHYGLDFGFANPSACVEVMFDGDMTFYIKELLYKPIKDMQGTLGDNLIFSGVPIGNTSYIFADSSDREPGTNKSMIADLRAFYNLNVVPVEKPTYKDRFEFINKAVIKYTRSSKNLEKEYAGYEYEYINGYPTERPVKVDDHICNALEYCVMMIKKHYKINL